MNITDDQKAYNIINNFCKKTTSTNSASLKTFGDSLTSQTIGKFNTDCTDVLKQTSIKLNDINNVNPNQQARDIIIDESDQILVSKKNNRLNSFNMEMNFFTSSMLENIKTTISEFVSSILKKFSNIASNTITSIQNLVTSYITNITNVITNMANGFIRNVTTALNNAYNNAINSINSLKSSISGLLNSANNIVNKAKKIKDNFYNRKVGESSVSNLIQANKLTSNGSIKPNLSVLESTPINKIVKPQLKLDINKTITFTKNPLASMLGFNASLIPTISQKKVEEPKPTDDKAEYGKITTNVNKAGFTKISDSTPGNVREINMHPSGTYNAMLDDGSCHTKTTGNKQEITDGDWQIKTEKDKIEIISGNNKIEIRKNYTQNITGSSDTNIDGIQNTIVQKDVTDDFKANYSGKIASNYTESVGGTKTENTSGDVVEKISGNHKETVSGALTITVVGNININAGGNVNINSSAKTTISAPNIDVNGTGMVNIKGTGPVNVQSSSLVKISAPMISLG